MLVKKGHLTPAERSFAESVAGTLDARYAAVKAGYSQPGRDAERLLARPGIQAEIAAYQSERLFNTALPAAVDCLIEIMQNAKAPAGARVQAAKLTFDRTLGVLDGTQGKEAHEMSGSELADAIAKLEGMAAARAKPVNPPDSSVFD